MTTPDLKVIELPPRDMTDIPRMLRKMAERVEKGEYGDAHNLVWVIDCGNGRVELGIMGRTLDEGGAEAHLLLALGQHRIELSALRMPTHA